MLRILLGAATAGLVACAPTLIPNPPTSDDPSNPAAHEALARAPSTTLEASAEAAPVRGPASAEPHQHPASSDGPPPSHATFVCPMHPEVTSDREGACPKCGMTLVPMQPREQP